MAKYGFDERRLLNISETEFSNDIASTPASGRYALYFDGGFLKRKNDAAAVVVFVEDGSNLAGADVVSGETPQYSIFTTKNGNGNLMQFRSIGSSDGTINMVMAGNVIDLTVDLSDINDELDHGLLLGLADDDHLQYLLLAGRAGGQIANGGTAASNNLTLRSTAHATKGSVKIDDDSKFEFNSLVYQQDSVQTTNATVTTVSLVSLADDTVYDIKARVVARRSDGGAEARAVHVIEGCFFRAAAGAATQQGSTKQHFKTESENVEVDFDVSSNDVRVRVTGVAAETWEWKAIVEYLPVSIA